MPEYEKDLVDEVRSVKHLFEMFKAEGFDDQVAATLTTATYLRQIAGTVEGEGINAMMRVYDPLGE